MTPFGIWKKVIQANSVTVKDRAYIVIRGLEVILSYIDVRLVREWRALHVRRVGAVVAVYARAVEHGGGAGGAPLRQRRRHHLGLYVVLLLFLVAFVAVLGLYLSVSSLSSSGRGLL